MSNDGNAGGIVSTIAGMALLYWLAVGLVWTLIFAVAAIILAFVIGITLLWGAFNYIRLANRAIADHNETEIKHLIIAPMLVPAGIMLGLFMTEVIHIAPMIDLMTLLEEANEHGYDTGESALISFMRLILMFAFAFLYVPFLWFGWAFAGRYSYKNSSFEGSVPISFSLWFGWGFAWALAIGWTHLQELVEKLSG